MTIADLRTRYPEFTVDKYPDAQVQLAIDDSVPFFGVCQWGQFIDQGQAAYVAWLLYDAMLTATGTPAKIELDPVVMKKVGDVQKQSSAQVLTLLAEKPYLSNKYGQRYSQLLDLLGHYSITV